MLVAQQIAAPPDACALARRLRAGGGRHLALLHASERVTGGAPGFAGPSGDPLSRWSYVAADPDLRSDRLDPLADDPDLEADLTPVAPPGLRRFPRWIGVLPYEHRRDLERPAWRPVDARPPALLSRPIWHRYPAVAAVDHIEGRVLVAGRTRADVDRLARRLGAEPPPPGPLRLEVADDDPPHLHVERVRAAKELILRGDLYQVNIARRLRLALLEGDPLTLHERLARAAPTPLGAFLDLGDGLTIASTSPELFLLAEPVPPAGGSPTISAITYGYDLIFTAPIKGTRPRGRDAEADAALMEDLDQDPKERAELTMIIDVERNDLGRIAVPGSVRLLGPPRVVTHRTIHHRVAWLSARVRPGVGREAALAAMLPSGSVTGAPKVRAMEVIASLEPRRRGLYTGALGFVAHDGRITLAMAIRTAVLAGREGEYFTGGGIVADSDPERELSETRWKALQLALSSS